MKYIELGNTGLRCSQVSFGGIPIQRSDAANTVAVVDALEKYGINYMDTARGYTVSEEYLGAALEGRREKFILATKSMSRSYEAMKADVETSRKNLRTDYIDVYQFHNPYLKDFEQIFGADGAYRALAEAKAAGKIGHIGVTAHSAEAFAYALTMDWVETIMFPYNIVETQGEELVAECQKRNIGFICMKPLAGGALEDATLALRFIAQNSAVSVVIPGMATVEEIEMNCAAVSDKSPLSEKELSEIEKVRRELGTNFCRRCNYCAPCAVGINISGAFLFAGYLERYGLADWARERYATLSVKASACIGCGVCETRCPYNLPIREKMKIIAKEFGE